jgi:hexosaminidase
MEIRTELGDVPRQPSAVGLSPSGVDRPDECFQLTVGPDLIAGRARTAEGLFRARTAALHLVNEDLLEPRIIDDAPHYAWRGLLIDAARHFWTPAELRQVIDLAALYHLNVLHLHLTDHEGWRIEIAGRPALTVEGPCYTAAEYQALQDYAAERFVTIVPEIDLPGHTGAALRAYPDLGTLPRPASLPTGVPFTPPLDLDDQRSRAFVTEVLAELARLTAGPYLHIGGDEALGSSGEAFATAIRFAREAVRAAGKRPLGWQEAARAGIEPGDIGQWWVDPAMMDLPATDAELAQRPELVEAGFTPDLVRALIRYFAPTAHDLGRIVAGGGRVLLSPQSHLYLDRPYAAAVLPEGAKKLGFAYRPRTVEYSAGWDPGAYGLAPENVAGVEAALWSEGLASFDDLTSMLLPRLVGIADAAWTGTAPSWPEFRRRLGAQAPLWRERGLTATLSTEVDWRL